MRRLLVALVFGAAALAACGLDVTGITYGDGGAPTTATDGGNTPETPDASASPPDAAPTSDGEAPPPCICTTEPPAGFELVAYRADQTMDCSAGLQKNDRETAPTIDANACSCGTCSITTMPDCETGSFGSMYDYNSSNAQCDSTSGSTHPVNNGQCTTASGSFANHGKLLAPAPAGSPACTSTGNPDQSKGHAKAVRVCAPAGGACACDPSPGFTTCFRKAGDVDCPVGTKTLVGTSTNVTCAACGCNVVNPTCSSKVEFFSDQNCATKQAEIDSDACKNAFANGNFAAYKFTGTPSATCQPSAPPTGDVALDGTVETICCP